MKLLLLSAAWLLGIWLGGWGSLFLLLAIPAVLLLAGWLGKVKALWLGLALALFVLGWLRVYVVTSPAEDPLVSYHGRGVVKMWGMVASDPEVGDRTTRFRLAVRGVATGEEWQAVAGSALVSALRYPGFSGRDFPYYRYGDLLEVQGTLKPPPALDTFDYREYLARQGIFTVVEFPQSVHLLGEGYGFRPLEVLYRLRLRLSHSLSRVLPEPQGSLGQGIFLGLRKDIPPAVTEAFNRTATTHIIAISGQNLTIILGLVTAVLVALWGRQRPYYFYLSLAVLWFYALLTGMAPPVTRAAIMGSLWLVAELAGRPRSAGPLLVLAAAVMVGVKSALLADISFQLSFAAMAGLAFLAPLFQVWGRKIAADRSYTGFLVDGVSITLAATLTTLPLIAYYFGRLSIVGLPATLVALPALPGIIIASVLASALGLVWLPLGQVAGWVAWLFLTWLLQAVMLFAGLPLASWQVDFQSPALVVGWYAALVGAVMVLSRRHLSAKGILPAVKLLPGRVRALPARWLLLPLLLVAALVWAAAFSLPDGRLHVWVLDVGQGDALLLRTPSGQEVLVDGGPSPRALTSQVGPQLPFWDRSLDLVVLSHGQEDHLAGLVEVLRRYRVARALESGLGSGSVYREWEKLLAQEGAVRYSAQAGQELRLGRGVVLEVLHPPALRLHDTGADLNNNSLVLRLRLGEVSFLLTGDLEAPGEAYLVAHGADVGSTVLKVAHHGSATSTTPGFLEAVSPQAAVISVGADNLYKHPNPTVVARLEQASDRVYTTWDNGTVEFITDGKTLWVKTSRHQ